MITLSKLLQHFPKPYLLVLTFLFLLMLAIGFWSSSQAPDGPKHTTTNTRLTLDLSQKLATESTQPLAPVPDEPQVDKWTSVTVKSGDSLSTLFQRVGLSAQDVYRVTQATKKSKSLSTLFPGDTLDFVLDNGELQKVRHIKTPLEQIIISHQGKGHYTVETITRQPIIETRFVQGVISSSLFVDGQRAGLSQKKLMELANIFGWDIDFALDIRKQDQFALIY